MQQATAVIHEGSRTAPIVAWLLCGLVLLLNACAGALAVLASDLRESVAIGLPPLTSSALVGGMVASRRPANPVGWFLLVFAGCLAIALFTEAYAAYGLLAEPGSLSYAAAMAWPPQWIWAPGVVMLLIFLPLYFPDGRLVSRRWRWVVWFAALFSVFATIFSAFQPGDVQNMGLPNPLGLEALEPFSSAVVYGGILPVWFGLLFLSAASLVVRFRHSETEQRQQIKWVVFAASAVPLWFIVSTFVENTVPVAFAIGEMLVFTGVPVAIGIAVLKYRLYDIDLIINRTLVYGALTACVVGLYVLVAGYLGSLFRTEGNLLVSLIAAGFVAVVFAPLRERLQIAVNRLMYGERDDPYAALSRLGQHLESTLSPDALLNSAVETVAEALRLPHATVEIERDGTLQTVAATGEPGENSMRLPLSYGGRTVGSLILGRRSGETDFSPTDRRLLEDLARQVSVAVHAARLTERAIELSEDLQRSRERLVTAREEERRRLRRDLHDGLGPQLASLAMKTEAARELIVGDPARADALLRAVTVRAQESVADIRRLVYGLRPPALDDLGLVGALRSQAAHGEYGGLSVDFEVSEKLPPLPAAVEVAAYLIAQEAVSNARRHGGARNCTVRLACDEGASGALRLEIQDDGRGISEDRRAGVGLSSMRERAEELGGYFKVSSPPKGGTLVYVSLPVTGREEHKPVTKQEMV